MLRWRRHRDWDPRRLGDLTMWEKTGEDDEDLLIWAEMTPSPRARDDVARLKQVLRDCGWTQTVGD